MAAKPVKLYVRAARGRNGVKVAASTKSNNQPLVETRDYRDVALPTIRFAVEFEIPDELFDQAEEPVTKIKVDRQMVDVLARQVP